MDLQDKSKIQWNIIFLFLLLAIGLITIGLVFYPVLLYLAGVLIFIANLILMAKRRKRLKRNQEKEWINSDDLF